MGDSYLPCSAMNQIDPRPYLVCITSNVNNNCCRGSDHPLWGISYILANDMADMIRIIEEQISQEVPMPSKYVLIGKELMSCPQLESIATCEVPDGSNISLIHRANITLYVASSMGELKN